MKIVFAAGGTAGHINPAIAIADYIKAHHPQSEISFIGVSGAMEERLVKNAGYDFYSIDVAGFQRKISVKNLARNASAAVKVFTATAQADKLLKQLKPDLAVGTGGYVTGPVLRKAAKLGIKTAVHESNAFPGVTVKMLASYMDAVMICDEAAKKHLRPKREYIVTGNPIRQELIAAKKDASKEKLNLDARPVILSYGGSLGARRINESVAEVMAWHCGGGEYQHIHAMGQYGTDWFPGYIKAKGVDLERQKQIRVSEYINNMSDCLAAADVVICRSGAMTISELCVQGKASILIPSPNVAENHQYYNALALADRDAAVVIEEKDLTGQRLVDELKKLLSDPEKLKQMGKNAAANAIYDANERIYKVLMELINSPAQ